MGVSWKLKFIQLTVTTHIVHWKGKVCLCNRVSISKTALALLGGQGQEYPQASPSGQWGRRWGLSRISHIAKFPAPLPALCNWDVEAQDWEKSWGWAVFLWALETVLGRNRENASAERYGGEIAPPGLRTVDLWPTSDPLYPEQCLTSVKSTEKWL